MARHRDDDHDAALTFPSTLGQMTLRKEPFDVFPHGR